MSPGGSLRGVPLLRQLGPRGLHNLQHEAIAHAHTCQGLRRQGQHELLPLLRLDSGLTALRMQRHDRHWHGPRTGITELHCRGDECRCGGGNDPAVHITNMIGLMCQHYSGQKIALVFKARS